MYDVSLSQQAEKDLDGIVGFVAQSSPAGADHVWTHLSSAINSLEVFPQRGAPAVEEAQSWGVEVRALIVFGYCIFYTVRRPEVVVLRIVHGRRRRPVSLED